MSDELVYNPMDGFVRDAKDGYPICEIRGYGHLSKKLGAEEAIKKQDALGYAIAALPRMLNRIDELDNQNKEIRELLKEVEFVLENENGDAVICPICLSMQSHEPNCKLAKILKEVAQ